MKQYEKPVLEIIELRPEERLATTNYIKNGENQDWSFTIFDKDTSDGNFDSFMFTSKTGQSGGGYLYGMTQDFIRSFLRTIGF